MNLSALLQNFLACGGAASWCCLLILMLAATSAKASSAPALRQQVSLNGAWDEGGQVPTYNGISKFSSQTFARRVTAPAAWTGQRIQLEFGAVNFVARVFIDDQKIGEHVGGWMPFAFDITGRVQPGQSFALRVEVDGPHAPPITDANGAFAWPVGGWNNKGGIADDVWLRAYGTVCIEDAFIQTSWRDKTLSVDYTLFNADSQTRTVTLNGDATRAGGEQVEASLGATVTLAAGERKTVKVMEAWPAPALYWPDAPALYHLRSTLRDAGKIVDAETRRFGFREVWIEGNQFKWNGVRINLFGDYQVFGDTWYTKPELYTPENWPATVDAIRAMNIRILRFHHNPVPQFALDVADEKGLLICDESANYAREYHKKSDPKLYLANALRSIAPWIVADRNHPSVYLWNATNEMTYDFAGSFEPKALLELGAEIKRLDPTRPVGYDGDNAHPGTARRSSPGEIKPGDNVIAASELIDHHYPEGYNKEPQGSIYSWAYLVSPDRPTGAGEVLHTRSPDAKVQEAVERNTWWLGIWSRGVRYSGWTNWKPACWWFTPADLASDNPAQRQRSLNLRNAYAPVALFDKAYDDLGIAPYVTGITPGGTLPTLEAGTRQQRTLILYNDEFQNTRVEVEVELKSGETIHARQSATFEVPLGQHIEFPCAFTVPATGGEPLELVLKTAKGGAPKFEEARRFTVTGTTRVVPDLKLR